MKKKCTHATYPRMVTLKSIVDKLNFIFPTEEGTQFVVWPTCTVHHHLAYYTDFIVTIELHD